MKESRKVACCPYCGSEDILRDAFARWSVDSQSWELSSDCDTADCGECGETHQGYYYRDEVGK